MREGEEGKEKMKDKDNVANYSGNYIPDRMVNGEGGQQQMNLLKLPPTQKRRCTQGVMGYADELFEMRCKQ